MDCNGFHSAKDTSDSYMPYGCVATLLVRAEQRSCTDSSCTKAFLPLPLDGVKLNSANSQLHEWNENKFSLYHNVSQTFSTGGFLDLLGLWPRLPIRATHCPGWQVFHEDSVTHPPTPRAGFHVSPVCQSQLTV